MDLIPNKTACPSAVSSDQKNLAWYDPNFSQAWLMGSIFTLNFVISVAIKTNRNLRSATLLNAVNAEIERNECLRLRFQKQRGKWKQQIVPPFALEHLECIDMRTASVREVESAVDRTAEIGMKVRRVFPPFQVYQFMGPEGDYILFKVLHVCCDAYGATLTLVDILQLYFAQLGLSDIPAPVSGVEEYMKNYDKVMATRTAKYEIAKQYFEEQYQRMGEPLYTPAKRGAFDSSKRRYLRTIMRIHKPASMYVSHVDRELTDSFREFCEQRGISLNVLFLTAFRTYYSAINGGQKDISLETTMHGRGKKNEKRLALPTSDLLRVRTFVEPEMSFEEAVKVMQEEYMMILRHRWFWQDSHQEYAMKHYGMKSPNDVYTDMLFGRIAINETVPEGWKIDAYWPRPKTVMEMLPIYMMAIDTSDKGMDFCYRYLKQLYDDKVLGDLHNGAIRILKRGLENPNVTIGELLKDFAE